MIPPCLNLNMNIFLGLSRWKQDAKTTTSNSLARGLNTKVTKGEFLAQCYKGYSLIWYYVGAAENFWMKVQHHARTLIKSTELLHLKLAHAMQKTTTAFTKLTYITKVQSVPLFPKMPVFRRFLEVCEHMHIFIICALERMGASFKH